MQSTITLNVTDKDVYGEDAYNPFEHRNVLHPTSTLGSFFHLLKSSLGSGLLAMPAAFKHTGLIPGCIGTALVGVIATHCVHILVTTSREICSHCRVSSLSYTDTCEKVFKHGPHKLRKYSQIVRHFADYAMAAVCLGGTSVYVIFIASSLKDICDHFNPNYTFTVKEYCGFLLIPLIALTQIRHLKFLVPFSLLANICLLLTFVITCIYTFSDLKDLSTVKLASSPAQWPLFLSHNDLLTPNDSNRCRYLSTGLITATLRVNGWTIADSNLILLFFCQKICDHFNPNYTFTVKEYCGFLLIPLIALTQIRHLKFLVPFSLLANICLLLTFVITCIYTFSDLKELSTVKLASSPAQWPLFLSTAIFAMEGINVVMPVENEMRKPEHFLGCPGVLNVTMVLVAVLYAVVGVFGYLKYGDDVKGSITINLPQDEILALIAKVMVATAVYFTYCLQMYAPMDIIWTRIKDSMKQKFHNTGQIILRTISVALTVILAVAVPDLELLIGLVGAIFFSTLGLFIPIVVETVHKWDRGLGKFKYILWKNTLLLLFYLLVLISGCYSSIKEIIIKYS
ncbi:Proton-coupled amino acid transporter 4 [Papilio machaon]|uniref:Proton-coupled amino acid transporter 4 n=1 Tax=Papilio machaon TaxID=76193 RepID=A0A0N1IIH6_PAPMA|nr:Proton-coupled amino acid transporter 4 [Papilio machaon]